jgi:hypothetical protein
MRNECRDFGKLIVPWSRSAFRAAGNGC